MSTFILLLDEGIGGLTVAVKDLIDVRGTPTTAGCLAVARRGVVALDDAACLAGVRTAVDAGRARLVGKANLHELAGGGTGINPWFGTPTNPLDARLVPGGSSSGSAVAVATGAADVAIGTDTAGSVRIPSACCGTVGLKTTFGRIATSGVWPLAASLDTVGPMARDVVGVVAGMDLLEPGFSPAPTPPGSVGRFRLPADPVIDAAIDSALRQAELSVTDVDLPGWNAAGDAVLTVILAEAWQADSSLVDSEEVGADLRRLLALGSALPTSKLDAARTTLRSWRLELAAALERHGVIALPTLVVDPPALEHGDPDGRLLLATAPVNGAGFPSLALPVPVAGRLPASLQLLGAPGSEELLVALGARVEAALG